jgi:hypothetical protein
VSGYRERLVKFVAARGVTLNYSERIAPARGLSFGGKITLLSGMLPAEEFSTLVHEIAHSCGQRFMWRPPRNAHKDGSITADQRHIIVE